MTTLPPDFVAELKKHFRGEIRVDLASRVLYSTDASMYQIEPTGVAVPRTQDDLQAALELAARYKLPVLPRGAGTSLAGQAIGSALILDCSHWLDGIVEIDREAQTATVEPGVVLAALNARAAQHGLRFGPDPASTDRATMGGVIGNNATGAHSIRYGTTADHIVSSDVILADGSLATLGEVPILRQPQSTETRYASLVGAAHEIREHYEQAIKDHYPATWRNAAGYRLNYLLPWSASAPSQWDDAGGGYPPASPGAFNLATLLAGSEGTLGVIRRATVKLVRKPAHTVLAVLAYTSIAQACDDVPRLLTKNPSAIELIPRMLVQLARGIPTYAAQMGWVVGDPAALLVVEFSGERADELTRKAHALDGVLTVAESAQEQARVWNVRRVGLGLLDSRPQSARPVAFIEDCAIPVEHLGEFVREVEKILAAHGVECGMYAHASAGCLHIRPILDLKTRRGVDALRTIAQAVVALTLRLGGAMSSEHGDGLARSEWLEQMYGPEIAEATRKLKSAADPEYLLNPGKIVGAPAMDANLRYGPAFQSKAWQPDLSLAANGGLILAIEQCNGQGVCRKTDGVMCPSYQATREEMHSTRGRANLLRAMIAAPRDASGALRDGELMEPVAQALDLCLGCKGCKAECPSGVDMAKLKYVFEAEYYKSHRRPIHDYLFGYFHVIAPWMAAGASLANVGMKHATLRRLAARALGIAADRPFPIFSSWTARPKPRSKMQRAGVIFLSDAFTRFVEPAIEQAAFDVLDSSGYDVHVLPTIVAAAAMVSKGFFASARKHAARVLAEIHRIDPAGAMSIVGIEPSELYAVKHDYVDLLPARTDELAARLTNKVWLLDEFLLREANFSPLRVATNLGALRFHPHCHQRAEGPSTDGLPTGAVATAALLSACGYQVEQIEAGCCGMAGTFGYERDHYQLSQRIGELKLFPIVRDSGGTPIVSTGAACRLQIAQGTGVQAEHPIMLVARAMKAG